MLVLEYPVITLILVSIDLIFLFTALFSTDNFFREEDYYYNNEEQTYASEQVDDLVSDQATHGTDPITEQLYNYHSFMKKKTPTIRWSKQETEVFYEVPISIILSHLIFFY